jgi:hypothetical protein
MRKLTSILDTRYSILDTRYSILDTRYSILDTRYSILLILLVGLLFSNYSFAGEYRYKKKCSVEYTQLDLITGTEVIYEDTSSEFTDADYCKEGLERLSEKIYEWAYTNNTNVVTNINSLKCSIKNIELNFTFFGKYKWSKYRDCKTYIQKFSAYLVDKYPNKIGAKVYQNSIAD